MLRETFTLQVSFRFARQSPSISCKVPAPMEEVPLDTARSRRARGIWAVRRVQLQPDGGGWRGPTA